MSADLNESLFEFLEDPIKVEEIKKVEIESYSAMLSSVTYFRYLNTRFISLDQADAYLGNVEVKLP